MATGLVGFAARSPDGIPRAYLEDVVVSASRGADLSRALVAALVDLLGPVHVVDESAGFRPTW